MRNKLYKRGFALLLGAVLMSTMVSNVVYAAEEEPVTQLPTESEQEETEAESAEEETELKPAEEETELELAEEDVYLYQGAADFDESGNAYGIWSQGGSLHMAFMPSGDTTWSEEPSFVQDGLQPDIKYLNGTEYIMYSKNESENNKIYLCQNKNNTLSNIDGFPMDADAGWLFLEGEQIYAVILKEETITLYRLSENDTLEEIESFETESSIRDIALSQAGENLVLAWQNTQDEITAYLQEGSIWKDLAGDLQGEALALASDESSVYLFDGHQLYGYEIEKEESWTEAGSLAQEAAEQDEITSAELSIKGQSIYLAYCSGETTISMGYFTENSFQEIWNINTETLLKVVALYPGEKLNIAYISYEDASRQDGIIETYASDYPKEDASKEEQEEPEAIEPEAPMLFSDPPLSGWQTIGGSIYYYLDGEPLTDIQDIGGYRYYFDETGAVTTGWFKFGSGWFYGDSDGKMLGGSQTIASKEYLMDEDGYYQLQGWQNVSGTMKYYNVSDEPAERYLVSATASEGWVDITIGSNVFKSYFRNGKPATGFQQIDNKKYYFNSYGVMYTGSQIIAGKTYLFGTDGVMQTGIVNIAGDSYCYDGEGVMLTGWISAGLNGKYYADLITGKLYKGWNSVGGTNCFFNSAKVYIPLTAPIISKAECSWHTSVEYRWQKVVGVDRYVVEYSTDQNFANNVQVITVNGETNTAANWEIGEGQTCFIRMKYIASCDGVEAESAYAAAIPVSSGGTVAPTANSIAAYACRVTGTADASGSNPQVTITLSGNCEDCLASSDNRYYVFAFNSMGEGDMTHLVGSAPKSKNPQIRFTLSGKAAANEAVMDQYAFAVRLSDGSFMKVSSNLYVTNPEGAACNNASYFVPASKKGIQGVDLHNAEDTASKNSLLNLDLASVVGTGPAYGYVPFEYKGRVYYFADCEALQDTVAHLNDGYMLRGRDVEVSVTLCILLSYNSANSYLIDPAGRTPGHSYYMLNVREAYARDTLEAVFLYLGEIFGQPHCYVSNWVLGNEVNSWVAYNYSGGLDINTYTDCYARAFKLLYYGIKRTKSTPRVFISLDNGWNAAPAGFTGRAVLDKFAYYAQCYSPYMNWNIAYHPYSAPLTRADFWNDYSNTTDNVSTAYISMRNIWVLSNYASAIEASYGKPGGSIRIILSEQGYTSSTSGEYWQAYAIARGYYITESDNRIDAFIIRAIKDDRSEIQGNLYLGIKDQYENKKTSYYVYEAMDSNPYVFAGVSLDSVGPENRTRLQNAIGIVCSTNWASQVPGWYIGKYTAMP